MEQRGAELLGGEALQPTGTGTIVCGGADVTDGPFVDAPDLDTAPAVARQCPACCGGVEVRPVMTFD